MRREELQEIKLMIILQALKHFFLTIRPRDSDGQTFVFHCSCVSQEVKARLNRRQQNADLPQLLHKNKTFIFHSSITELLLPMVINFPLKGFWIENTFLVIWKENIITTSPKFHWQVGFVGERFVLLELYLVQQNRSTNKCLQVSVGQSAQRHGKSIWRCDFWAWLWLWG